MSADLSDRYGARRPWLRPVVVVASVLLAAAFLGWLAWATWFHATPEVESELVSWEVVSEHEARATVEVVLADRTVQGTCTLRAYADDHTTVGELSFEVPGPDFDEGGPLVRTIRTERRATSVTLLGCTTPDQSRPR